MSSETALTATGAGDRYQYQQGQYAAPPIPDYGAPAGGYDYAQGPKLASGMATASLVLGILGIFTLGLALVGSLIGVILGIRAVLNANREPSAYGGKGIAIGGIVTNALAILTIIPVALIAAIAIPNLMLSRTLANEASAIEHLRRLSTAEATYQSTEGRGQAFGTFEELIESGLVPGDSANKSGYQFKIRLRNANGRAVLNGGSDAVGFEVLATPNSYPSTGRMSYYVSENYLIRCADREGEEATMSDPDLESYFEQQEPAYGRRPTNRGGGSRRRD